MGYTAVTGTLSFAHSRVCHCCRRFRFHTHNATRFVCKLCSLRFRCCVHSSASFTKIMVEQLLQVTSEYEERLRRCQYVPRFSFGRRMLRDDGAPNRFYLVYLFCEESIAIQFLKDIGLIRNKMQCKTCGRNMTSAHSTRSEGFRWRCRIHSSPPPPAWPRTVLIILRLGLLVLFFF